MAIKTNPPRAHGVDTRKASAPSASLTCATSRLTPSKHLHEIFSSAPLPHPLVVQRFLEIRILRQNARESTLAATTSTRTASVTRETKAALIGVPTLSSLFLPR